MSAHQATIAALLQSSGLVSAMVVMVPQHSWWRGRKESGGIPISFCWIMAVNRAHALKWRRIHSWLTLPGLISPRRWVFCEILLNTLVTNAYYSF
jgi:hypothetical protein